MTTSAPPAPPARVKPEPGSRLEQLAALHDELKAKAEQASQDYEAVKEAIKSELASAAPGSTKVVLESDELVKPLTMSHRTEWRIDSRKLKAEDPTTWVRYAKQVESWRLERAR